MIKLNKSTAARGRVDGGPYLVKQPSRALRCASPDHPNATTIAVFFHMRKCAGTSLRLVFDRQESWQLLPYCTSPAMAIDRGLRAPHPFMLLELHCSPHLHDAGQVLEASRQQLAAAGRNPLRIFSFTVLRHPVDLLLSEHKYFGLTRQAHAAWVRAHAEDFLFSKRFLGLRRPAHWSHRICMNSGIADRVPCLNDTECRGLEEIVLHKLAVIDHLAFMENASSFHPITRMSRLPDANGGEVLGELPPVPRKNAVCRYCHGARPATALSRRQRVANTTVLTWQRGNESQSITVAALRALANRANRCSVRIYTAIRKSRAC